MTVLSCPACRTTPWTSGLLSLCQCSRLFVNERSRESSWPARMSVNPDRVSVQLQANPKRLLLQVPNATEGSWLPERYRSCGDHVVPHPGLDVVEAVLEAAAVDSVLED